MLLNFCLFFSCYSVLYYKGVSIESLEGKKGTLFHCFNMKHRAFFLMVKWYEGFQLVFHFGGGIPLAP